MGNFCIKIARVLGTGRIAGNPEGTLKIGFCLVSGQISHCVFRIVHINCRFNPSFLWRA
jgi:hypothetical protein